MSAVVGLQTHIWNNNLKSMILLGLYPLVILAMAWGAAYVFAMNAPHAPQPGMNEQDILVNSANSFLYAYWPVIVGVVAIWFLVAWFFHTQMVGALAKSHPVSRQDEPELYNLLENLCIAQGMPMPQLNIIETHALNAFASGINEKSFAVTVTRGLMNRLSKDELEAVLAHELTHILNRDVRLLMVSIIFTGMIGFAAQMVWRSIRYRIFWGGGNSKNKGGAVLLILAIALILWLGYMVTLFTRFAISRRREYMADAGAVQMTRNPDAMMRALLRISGRAQIPGATGDVMMMCVENSKPFMGLFQTHPPIDQRIEALSISTNTPIPTLPHTGPAPIEARFKNPWDEDHGPQSKNPWLTAQRRRR